MLSISSERSQAFNRLLPKKSSGALRDKRGLVARKIVYRQMSALVFSLNMGFQAPLASFVFVDFSILIFLCSLFLRKIAIFEQFVVNLAIRNIVTYMY